MGLYRDESGRLLELDDAFAQARGYEQASPLELEAINAEAGEAARGEERGVVGDINAVATGFASGLTLGGSDYLLGKTLSPLERERVLAEIEAHPTLRAGGEIAGTLVSTLDGMGATPTGYLSSYAGKAIERGIEKGGLAGYGTALAAMGAEGGAQSAGSYIGHAALEDKELTAEGLTGAAGVGFAFGAGGGGAALGVVKGTVAARRMFSRVMAGEKAAREAESAWSIASQEALEADTATARAAEIKLENIRQAKIAAQREVNAARASAAEERIAKSTIAPEPTLAPEPDLPVGPEPLIDVGAQPKGGMPTSVFKRPAPAEGPEPLIDVGEKPAGGGVTSVFERPAASVETPASAAAEAPTALEQQLAGTKAQLDKGVPFREVNEGAVPGSPVSPQIPPGKAPPHQPGRAQPSSSINDWLAEKTAFDADELSQARKIEDIRGARELRNRRQETLREIRFKKTEELLGTAVAKEEQRIAEVLDEYNSARQELEGLAGFGPESNGVPEVPLGHGERQAAAILDDAHEEALLRAKHAVDPAEGGQAIQEAHELERLLEELSAPRTLQHGDNGALSARDLRSPKAEEWLDKLRAEVDKVKRYEDASAKLADEVGDQAHPISVEKTKNLRAAEKDSERKVFERTARAADDTADEVVGPQIDPKVRLNRAKDNLAELKVQHEEATFDAKQANKQVKVGERAKKAALREDAKTAKQVSLASKAAEAGGLLEFMDVPGMPKPSDLPVVGPLLGMYLKYRTAKGVMGRVMGRTAATADAKAAVLAAQTRDRIARAVDRSLGAIERTATKGTKTMPLIAGVLANRVYDDGQPDAKKGAPLPELAATRMREIAAYVSTPGAIERDVRRELAGVTDPDLIAATEKQRRVAMEYLLSTMPKLPEPGLLNNKPMLPSPLQALQLGRRMEAIGDPPALFERLANEQDLLSLEAAEALRKVYPKLFSEAQQRVLDQVTSGNRSVPMRQRIQLSLLYRLPLDSSLDPDNLKITQSVFERKVSSPAYNPNVPGAAAPQGPTAQPSIANPVNIAQAYDPSNNRR